MLEQRVTFWNEFNGAFSALLDIIISRNSALATTLYCPGENALCSKTLNTGLCVVIIVFRAEKQ